VKTDSDGSGRSPRSRAASSSFSRSTRSTFCRAPRAHVLSSTRGRVLTREPSARAHAAAGASHSICELRVCQALKTDAAASVVGVRHHMVILETVAVHNLRAALCEGPTRPWFGGWKF
jgi:hypothetical protein